MKPLTFIYKCSMEQLINSISKDAQRWTEAFLFNSVYCKIKNNKVRLQKRIKLQHPLQRFFLGEIVSENNITILKGKFCFPFVKALIFLLLFFICIYGNISLVQSNSTLKAKIIGTSIFIFIQSVIILLFVTGIEFYKEQENEIVKFLQARQGDSLDEDKGA